MEEKRFGLDMVLHIEDDCPEKRLKDGSFSPQSGPRRGMHLIEHPFAII